MLFISKLHICVFSSVNIRTRRKQKQMGKNNTRLLIYPHELICMMRMCERTKERDKLMWLNFKLEEN